MKIDTDGAGVRSFVERLNAVVEAGFTLFDVVDSCYYDGRFAQCDVILINNRIAQQYDLHIYGRGERFDVAKWKSAL